MLSRNRLRRLVVVLVFAVLVSTLTVSGVTYGTSTQMSAGWQVLSLRALDRSRSLVRDGMIVQPWHPYTKESEQAVTGTANPNRMAVVDRIALKNAIAQLPNGYRRVFLLHDVQGFEHEEVARIMGISVGTSKSQLHKARLKLRGLLLQESAG